MKALWQKIVAPFQRLSLWIQNRFRSPETVTPEKSPVEPAENPKNGSVPNLSIQPVTPGTPEVQESNSLLAPGTGEAGELVLSPVQEALNNAQQDKALQLQEDEALALQLQESAGGSQVMPTAPVANTPSPALMQELFGSDLTRIQFQQQGGNTCYLLSALDAIFHHPQGKQILAKIQITRTPDGYSVKFPGQPEVVNVKEQELVTDEKNLKLANGEQVYGVNSECKGVRILECAYSKLDPHPIEPTETFGEEQSASLALEKIFGQNMNQSRSIRMDSIPGAYQCIGETAFSYEERKIKLQEYLRSIRKNTSTPNHFDIFTIIPKNGGKHYESIRLNQSTPKHIVIADPFDTEKKVKTIPIDELLDQYHIEGLRVYR